MPVESTNLISGLNPSWPLVSDTVESTQNHLVLLKEVLQGQFPNLGNTPVTASAAALNGATSAFGTGVFTVPQVGVVAASVVIPAAPGGTSVTITSGSGLEVISQGPTVGSATPAPVTEIVTDGLGDVGILKSLTVPAIAVSGAATIGTTLSVGTSINSASIMKGGAELVPTGIGGFWCGTIASIPAGWHLCDGTNGTPDLRDKMIIGAGNTYAVGATGGSATVSLALANIPSHSHAITDPGHGHVIVDPGHTHAITDPGHVHGIVDPGHVHTLPGGVYGGGTSNYNTGTTGTVSAQGGITISATTGIAVKTGTTGITQAPSATLVTNTPNTTGITVGSTGSGTAFGILPPYYALAFIMKL